MELESTPAGQVVISPTSEEAAALGEELGTLLDWFTTALTGLAHLRAGSTDQFDSTTWRHMLNRTERDLACHLEGIRDALIPRHAAAGGSYGQLAVAMGVTRSTTQYRRDRLTAAEPSPWETWAVTGTPVATDRPRDDEDDD